MNAIATSYIERVPCAAKDWEDRRRIPFILQVAKDYNVQGALLIQQEFCDPHELDIPAIRKSLESNGIPTYFLEFDISAPLGNETFRYMTDAEPPWSFLRLCRYLEEYGGVSIGSIYSHSLIGMWEDQEDGSLGPRKPPQQKGIHLKDRDHALRFLADWQLALPDWQAYYDVRLKSEHMIRIAREWRCNYALMHFNRGCEGTSVGLPENRAVLINAGIPTVAFEGNMADPGEVDEVGIMHRIDVFMHAHGHERLEN